MLTNEERVCIVIALHLLRILFGEFQVFIHLHEFEHQCVAVFHGAVHLEREGSRDKVTGMSYLVASLFLVIESDGFRNFILNSYL